MRHSVGWSRCVAFTAFLMAVGVARPAYTAEQDVTKLFGSLPNFGAVSLSPGGKLLAFVMPIDGVENIAVLPLEPGIKPSRFAIADSIPRRLVWHDNEQILGTLRLLFRAPGRVSFGQYVGVTFRSYFQDFLFSGRGDNVYKRLETNPSGLFGPASSLVELASSNPDIVFFSAVMPGPPGYDRAYAVPYFSTDLFSVNLKTGRVVLVHAGQPETARWFMDGTGKIVARLDITKASQDEIYVPAGRDFKKIATIEPADGRVIGLTEDGKGLAVLGRRDGDRLGLYRLNLTDGKFAEPLFVNPQSDIVKVLIDERTFRVVGVGYDDGGQRIAYFAPERQRLQKQIEDVLPGRIVNLASMTTDRSKIAVVASGPQNPPALQLVNLKTSRIDTIAEAYPQLHGTRLGEVRRHPYTSRDGLALVGLLTLPPDVEPKSLPVVVLPAGGFGYSDGSFDWFAQFLAHRGYAVFQAGARNFKGLGDVSGMDELGVWMNASQDDIARGVDDLVAKGIANEKRICIAGADSNGYIALAATIFMPNKYACAINLAGISDLRMILRGTGNSAEIAQNVFNSTLIRNRREYSDEDLERFSPARHAEAVRSPVLLIFGERDGGKEQGDAMNEALTGANKTVEYITLKDDDGSLSRTDSRIALLNAVDTFLARHIGK